MTTKQKTTEFYEVLEKYLPKSYVTRTLEKLGLEVNEKNRHRVYSVRHRGVSDLLIQKALLEVVNEEIELVKETKRILENTTV